MKRVIRRLNTVRRRLRDLPPRDPRLEAEVSELVRERGEFSARLQRTEPRGAGRGPASPGRDPLPERPTQPQQPPTVGRASIWADPHVAHLRDRGYALLAQGHERRLSDGELQESIRVGRELDELWRRLVQERERGERQAVEAQGRGLTTE